MIPPDLRVKNLEAAPRRTEDGPTIARGMRHAGCGTRRLPHPPCFFLMRKAAGNARVPALRRQPKLFCRERIAARAAFFPAMVFPRPGASRAVKRMERKNGI